MANLIEHHIPFGLMHIDLDYFKAVNDTLGHAAGDHVLRQVAQSLLLETRSGDTVARVGGDEFVILFNGLTEPESLSRIANRVVERLSEPSDFQGEVCRISASIGITISTDYLPPEAEQMLSDADTALYASKNAGRGQAQLFRGDRRAAGE
jgi:diguanylate cyclase (GGDEF)-like protein